ncbi:MAG: hypothetical protein ACP5GX_09295, partial [Anaerolineae bacterium]
SQVIYHLAVGDGENLVTLTNTRYGIRRMPMEMSSKISFDTNRKGTYTSDTRIYRESNHHVASHTIN